MKDLIAKHDTETPMAEQFGLVMDKKSDDKAAFHKETLVKAPTKDDIAMP